MKKFLKVLGNILVFAFLAVAVVVMASVLTAQKNRGIPQIFGYSMMNIKTDSMEPTIKEGDLIIISRKGDFNKLKVNDVITFTTIFEDMPIDKTHRIVEIGKGKLDAVTYITKGDKPNLEKDLDPVYADQVIGVWNNVRVPRLGTVMEFLKTQLGIMLCVILPLTILFIWQLYKFIMLIAENKKQKALAEVSADIEAEKQKAVEEYIAQQKAEQEAQAVVNAKLGHMNNPVGNDAPAVPEENEPQPVGNDAPVVPEENEPQPVGNDAPVLPEDAPAVPPADEPDNIS